MADIYLNKANGEKLAIVEDNKIKFFDGDTIQTTYDDEQYIFDTLFLKKGILISGIRVLRNVDDEDSSLVYEGESLSISDEDILKVLKIVKIDNPEHKKIFHEAIRRYEIFLEIYESFKNIIKKVSKL